MSIIYRSQLHRLVTWELAQTRWPELVVSGSSRADAYQGAVVQTLTITNDGGKATPLIVGNPWDPFINKIRIKYKAIGITSH